jgi:NTP pyrophosphatase (non-canonical NTP hydrolase)
MDKFFFYSLLFDNKEVGEMLIEFNGRHYQSLVVQEELLELGKEILKAENRSIINRERIIDELADVLFTLEQIKIIHNISEKELQDHFAYIRQRHISNIDHLKPEILEKRVKMKEEETSSKKKGDKDSSDLYVRWLDEISVSSINSILKEKFDRYSSNRIALIQNYVKAYKELKEDVCKDMKKLTNIVTDVLCSEFPKGTDDMLEIEEIVKKSILKKYNM